MSSESPTPARPVRRFRIGFLSVVQTLLVIAVFISLNFLSAQKYRRLDMSDDLAYTLSSAARRYLDSDTIAGRADPIQMIVAFRADSPLYDKVRPLAEEFARLSGGKIQLQILDPIRANDFAETIAATYGIVFNQDLVIIDARSAGERASQTTKIASPHVNIVKLEDMVVYETDANSQRRVRGFLGEDAITSGFVNAIEGKAREMWILNDKSNLTAEDQDGVWPVLSANLVSQNVHPDRRSIAGLDRIPDEVEALGIIAPLYDFTPEEIRLLEEYWKRPRSAIFVSCGENEVPPRLRAFLRKNGVTPRNDRVINMKGDFIQTSVLARFTSGMEFTRDLWEKTTLLEGTSRSLEVRENQDDLRAQGVNPYTLLEAANGFWGETRFTADKVGFDPSEDNLGPAGAADEARHGLALAAAVIKGSPNDDRFADDTSRMIVIGNTDFLRPDKVRQVNLDFVASSVNWLIGREELTGIGPRGLRLYKLPLLKPQVTFINRVNLLFLPGFALLVGALVWSSRRA